MLKVEVEITTSIVAWAALITTILQFLSGMYVPLRVMVSSSLVLIQICLKIQKRGNTSDISAFPFIAAIISCSLWLKYGILRDDHTLIIVNTIGLVLQICYLLFYYYRCVNKGPLNFNLLIAVSILFPLLVYVKFFVEDQETAVSRTGLMACTAGVVFCASPLASLAQVIRTKSTDSLPYHLICSTFLGSSLWVLYGSLISDQFVMIPNIFGALIASLQLLLFGIYPKRNTYSI